MHTLLPEMRAIDSGTSITIETSSEIPGLNMRDDDRLTYLAHALSRGRQDVTGQRTSKVAYATEAGLFQIAGIPSIICGPGSIEQAHKPDEYITLEQIARCEAFMARLTEELVR